MLLIDDIDDEVEHSACAELPCVDLFLLRFIPARQSLVICRPTTALCFVLREMQALIVLMTGGRF